MNYRLLVVDDEEGVRILYKEELEEAGFLVEVASSGKDAVKRLGDTDQLFDLVILDIKMDDMDGIDVLRQIKGRWKELPVVLCSAYHHYKQDFGSWASDAYVVKSSNLDELKDTVNSLLGR